MYKWRKRYDSRIESLKDRPIAPTTPRSTETERGRAVAGTAAESKVHGRDLLLAYEKAKGENPALSGTALQQEKRAKKRKKHSSKPYTPTGYPGQKVQIDVKYAAGSLLCGWPAAVCFRGKKRVQLLVILRDVRRTFE